MILCNSRFKFTLKYLVEVSTHRPDFHRVLNDIDLDRLVSKFSPCQHHWAKEPLDVPCCARATQMSTMEDR